MVISVKTQTKKKPNKTVQYSAVDTAASAAAKHITQVSIMQCAE